LCRLAKSSPTSVGISLSSLSVLLPVNYKTRMLNFIEKMILHINFFI
jgi:hypothetical protein